VLPLIPRKNTHMRIFHFSGLILTLALLLLPMKIISSPFTISESNENEIVLTYSAPDYEIVPVDINGTTYHRISGDLVHFHAKEGYPLLPYFSENVGIPVDGRIELSLENQISEYTSGINIRPAEKMLVLDNGETDYQFYQSRSAYNSSTDYPTSILQTGVDALAADRRFSSFIFSPFLFNAREQKLTVITEATIRIRIYGNKTVSRNLTPERSYIDRAGDLFFLNNDESQNWRKPREHNPDFQPLRSSGISQIQFVVDSEGIYQVTYELLSQHLNSWQDSLGYDVDFDINSIDPRYLELTHQNGLVPIHFVGERDGSFDPGDYFEFYGDRNYGKEGYSDTYTAENVYTLSLEDSWGARMAVENGGIRETNPRNYILPVSYEQTIHLEQQNTFSALGARFTPREDLWFWKTLNAPEMNVTTFELQYPHQNHLRGFTANVCLVGLTDTPHHARVRLNAAFIGEHTANTWSGQAERIFTNDSHLANEYLNHGTNYLYVEMPGDTSAGAQERILLDYLTLSYWREYITDSDYIKFSRPSNRPLGLYQFELDNFSTEDVSVYKINSSFMENIQIEPFSDSGLPPFKISFQDEVVAHDVEYYAVTETNKKTPKVIRPRIPSTLKDPNNTADYVIITVRDFLEDEGTQLLKSTWENRGVMVKLVDVQNIFDEFNYGVRHAQPIKDFLSYAYNNWTVSMTHVLFLGKGIFDERDHSVDRSINYIPYKNIWTYKLGATPSDNWFACIVGDDAIPDINIARIPVQTADQILPVAEKTVHYIENQNFQNLWQPKVTLTAGGRITDDNDIFSQQSEQIRARWIPKDYHVIRVYTNTQTVSEQYLGGTFKLKDSWNDGTSYLQFMGHGGGRIWADYNLLNNNDIATLNNSNYPFVTSLSCYPSDFSRPGAGSIGENMILKGNRGAIAHVGFSGLGYLYEDLEVGYHMTEAIFHRNLSNFGDIASFTKAKTYATIMNPLPQTALTQASVLFADPMLSFNLPQDRVQVELDKYNLSEGDTLMVSVDMGSDINFARIHVQSDKEVTQNIPFDLPVVDGVFQTQYVIPDTPQNNYKRLVKIFGYGSDRQVVGMTSFNIGSSAVVDVVSIPDQPTQHDSVHISASFFNEHGINSVICQVDTLSYEMTYSAELNKYTTNDPLNPKPAGSVVNYNFAITNGQNQVIESEMFSYRINGPDLAVNHAELSSLDNKPALKVYIKNWGEIESPQSSVNVYKRIGTDNTLLNSKPVPALAPLEDVYIYVDFEPLQETLRFEVHVNPEATFSELNTNNNTFRTGQYAINMFYAGADEAVAQSLDGNFEVEIPSNTFAENIVFYINSSSFSEPSNQPDAHKISLLNNSMSMSYDIGVLDQSVLQDTTGLLPANKQITVTMYYNPEDENNINWESENSFAFYRYQNEFNKWLHHGGFISTANKLVFQPISRLGSYTILRNNDQTAPLITANVQDQEFTYGGYISGTGVVSLTLADANGIDIFDRELELFLNGSIVPEEDYTISANPGNLTSVPIKYQLDIDAGDYTLFISCADVNGNFASHEINFIVNTSFDVINLANYPNPILTDTIDPVNEGRTRFTYVLTDDADDVNIKIYTVSGRLVKTFSHLPKGVGYHEYPRTVLGWDCRDDSGVYLANGVYFYKIIARRGGKTIERIQKMAITR